MQNPLFKIATFPIGSISITMLAKFSLVALAWHLKKKLFHTYESFR